MLRLQDTAWNIIQYTPTSPDPPAEPTRRLPPGTLTFTVANSVQLDTTPPVISDVSITSSADVSDADVTITADLTVTDAGSGVYSVSLAAGHPADATDLGMDAHPSRWGGGRNLVHQQRRVR